MTLESSPPSKRKLFHEWAQSSTEARSVISKMTVENQIVLDPMMGSGTTGDAALQLNRKFVGIEIDPKSFAIAKSRLLTKLS
jgi:DNA modification methylase